MIADDNVVVLHAGWDVPNYRWYELEGLRVANPSAGNDLLTVVSVELDRSPRRVYNFEVEGLHSYAVGENGEWVHNWSHRPPASPRFSP